MSELRQRLLARLGAAWTDDGVLLRPRAAHPGTANRAAYRAAGGTYQRSRALDPHQSGYYDAPRYRAEIERLLATVGSNALIADIGCGDGRGIDMLLDAGATAVVGIDFNDVALGALADTLPAAARECVVLLCADLDADAAPALAADAALMFEVASVIADLAIPLRSAAGLLRPGGHLLASDPAAEGLCVHALLNGDWANLARIAGERRYRDTVGGHAIDIHLRSQPEFAAAANAAGFELLESHSFPALAALALHAARRDDALAAFDELGPALAAVPDLLIPRLNVHHLRTRR